MSPRALAALDDATRMAASAEKRCKAVLAFRNSAGQQCGEACVSDSPFCWTHTKAAQSEQRRAPLMMFPDYVGKAR
jgi:hypothetical protein